MTGFPDASETQGEIAMTLNITATSSPSLSQTSANPWHKTGPTEKQAGASADASFPRAAAKSAETPSTSTTVPSAKELAEAVDQLNQHFHNLSQTHLQFSLDKQSGAMVVKVMDVESKEVIRQIPSQEALALSAFLKEQTVKESQGMNSVALDGLLLRAKV